MSKKETAAVKQAKMEKASQLFGRENYMWMLIGIAVIALGMILMAGGKNDNPNEFDVNKVYGTKNITVAPILVVLGFIIEIYAIFRKPKAAK
jgi:uncharacterized membrane protein